LFKLEKMKLFPPSSLFFTILLLIRGAQGVTFAATCQTPTFSGVSLCASCKNDDGEYESGCLDLDECFYNLDGLLEPGSE
jgi:CVNH domain